MGANFAPLGVMAIQYLLLMFHECMQWRAEGGRRTGRRPRASKERGHPKGAIAKIEMLQLDDFSYCKITNARCMHVGVGRNFLQGGANSGFSRGSQKDFARGGE